MNKKLTAKSQKIVPSIPDVSNCLSGIVTNTPDDENLLRKKGTVYAVYEITGPTAVETNLVNQMVGDVLHDSYYQSDNISPVQSLEKAVQEVKESISRLFEKEGSAVTEEISFNITAAVLWGNVLYMVQHGSGSSFIMREGSTKPVSMIAEGNFSAASGVVRHDDVIVIGTQSFIDKCPPEHLLTATGTTFEGLPANSSCLMLKFIVESTFSGEESIDFGIPKKKTSIIPESLTKLLRREKGKKNEIRSIAGTRDKKRIEIKRPLIFIIPVIAVLLVLSISKTISKRNSEELSPVSDTVKETDTTEGSGDETTQATTETIEEEPEGEVFYDLKITDPAAQPTEIAVVGSNIVVADKSTGKIYVSDTQIAKFTEVSQVFTDIHSIFSFKDLLNFADSTQYKTYSIENSAVSESYSLAGAQIVQTYLDYIYAVEGDTLNKYVKEGNSLSGSLWAQSSDFEGAKSMAISVSIYVVTKDGEIVKYTSGNKETFEITGMEGNLAEPVQIVGNLDTKYFYIADRAAGSIVVMDKDGDFVKTVTADSWKDIKGIGINSDESKAYVLSGTKVYETEL